MSDSTRASGHGGSRLTTDGGSARRQPTREELARLEMGRTRIRPATAALLAAVFVSAICAEPVVQHVWHALGGSKVAAPARQGETGAAEPGRRGPLAFLSLLPSLEEIRAVRGVTDAWRLVPSSSALRAFEEDLRRASPLAQALIPPLQALRLRFGGTGHERAWTGRDGWLFYEPGVRYLTHGPFLAPERLAAKRRYTARQPDPVRAIRDFHKQLQARDVELLVVPTPVKPMIEPAKLSARYRGRERIVQNPSYRGFRRRLREAGVAVLDPGRLLRKRSTGTGRSPYLQRDTHWRPEAMEAVARAVARRARERFDLPAPREARYTRSAAPVRHHGDIAEMLNLPQTSVFYEKQRVTVHPVRRSDGTPWKPSRSAPVLLLGDSFSNIYTAPSMGWGESAGLAPQLSFALGLPLDAIVRNADGAHATREALARDIRRHYERFDRTGAVAQRERLIDKKLVIWQFAMRELLVGDWRLVELPDASPEAAGPARTRPREKGRGAAIRVRATVADLARPPRPHRVAYGDCVMSLHLEEIEVLSGELEAPELLVYLLGMRDNEWLAPAELKKGERIELRIEPWKRVRDRYGGLQLKTLGTSADLLRPWWGRLVP